LNLELEMELELEVDLARKEELEVSAGWVSGL